MRTIRWGARALWIASMAILLFGALAFWAVVIFTVLIVSPKTKRCFYPHPLSVIGLPEICEEIKMAPDDSALA